MDKIQAFRDKMRDYGIEKVVLVAQSENESVLVVGKDANEIIREWIYTPQPEDNIISVIEYYQSNHD